MFIDQLPIHILELEQQGLVTRTFRRLDPERQKSILESILEEAAEKGPTNINIKHVAERAGISVGSLYTYFNSRQGLLEFATRLCIDLYARLFPMAYEYLKDLPLAEALAQYLQSGIEMTQTQVGLIQFFGRAAYQGDPALHKTVVEPIATIMLDTVRALLKNAASRGEIRSDLDMEATARVINALLIAVGDSQLFPFLNDYFLVTGEDITSERAIKAMVEVIMHGISKSE